MGGFSLLDGTRAGHRVILSILLADPNERVLSTAQVPPQHVSQREAQLLREQLDDERDCFAGVTQQAWAAERWTVAEYDMDMDSDE